MEMRPNPRKAGPLDQLIGSRIAAARSGRKMSQEVLADRLMISPQQLQKYECARDRVSASRLLTIAQILEKPVSYFFNE